MYSDNSFWQKLKRFALQAGEKTVRTTLLMYYAYKRPDTPTWAKTVILGALGYFLSPIDAIPDLTPLVGYTDDMSVLATALATVAAYVNEEVKAKAEAQLERWFGRKVESSDAS